MCGKIAVLYGCPRISGFSTYHNELRSISGTTFEGVWMIPHIPRWTEVERSVVAKRKEHCGKEL
jgi:hypothetical protein